jgi:hypothetical protein
LRISVQFECLLRVRSPVGKIFGSSQNGGRWAILGAKEFCCQ